MIGELLGTIYGLASAFSWGTGDFGGGMASKRSGVYSVVIGSQVIGFVLLVLLALLFGEPFPELSSIRWALLAGLFGSVGIVALYQGLASGRMGVVAPVSALTAGVVPVLVSIATEGLPSATRLAGFAIALVAVWLVSKTEAVGRIALWELTLPVTAGLAIGGFFVFINLVATDSVFAPLAFARTASLALLFGIALLRSVPLVPAPASWRFVLLSGVFDTGGNVFFVLSAQVGRLDVAAIVSSLYPAVTVILAWRVLQERLGVEQWVGVALSVVAIVLITL